MTRRTVLLLFGLFCCWNAQALAQTVDTSATGTLTEQTSSATQQVTTAAQELEPVTNQVSSTADSVTSTGTGSGTSTGTGSGTSTGTGSTTADDSSPDDSSGGSGAAERCETAAGGGAPGGGSILTSASGGARHASFAVRRERGWQANGEGSQANGEGVLGSVAEGTDAMPAPVPTAPSEFPFWGGIAVLILLGLGLAGLMAALTTHVLRRVSSG
jgi:hypothetical protein